MEVATTFQYDMERVKHMLGYGEEPTERQYPDLEQQSDMIGEGLLTKGNPDDEDISYSQMPDTLKNLAVEEPQEQKSGLKQRLYKIWSFGCSSPGRQCLTLAVLTVVLCVIMLPVVVYAIVPGLTGHYVKGASIELVQAQVIHVLFVSLDELNVHPQIYNATKDTMQLEATIQVGNAGPFSASLDSFQATLNYKGTDIGYMPFPSFDITANASTTVLVSAPITVTNPEAMAQSFAELFKGSGATWQVRASVDVTLFGFLHPSASLDNALVLPPLTLENMIADQMEPTAGDGKTGELDSDVVVTPHCYS